MKDKGIVISTDKDFARVDVDCLSICDTCGASTLCIKKDQEKGLMSVRNTLQARPGDTVTIDVPDTTYSRTLIWLFSTLLGGCLAGMTAGYLSSLWIPLDSSEASLIGLLLGVLIAGYWLYRRFRKKNGMHLYPTIVQITHKGEHHE